MLKVSLITGASGMDGSILSKQLLDKGHKVIAMLRRTSSPTNWRWQELGINGHRNLQVVFGDLSDQSSIDRIVSEYKPNEIYNLAANSFVGSSWNLAESVLDVTGIGAFRVFEAARKHCKEARIYCASSSEQFGNNESHVLNEESIMRPVSPYGAAKLLSYNMAKIYRESYGMFISCGILFNHCGPYRGEEFVTRKISKSVALIKHGLLDHISLGNINTVRDEGSAEEYTQAMYLILQNPYPDDFVIATGNSLSVFDFATYAFEVIDINITMGNIDKYITIDKNLLRPKELHFLCGDASKARAILNWKPKKTVKDIVKEMVEHDLERVKNGMEKHGN